jgi:hypothetical protein
MKTLRWIRCLVALVFTAGALLPFAPPVHAAEPSPSASLFAVQVAKPVVGRVGEDVTVNYKVINKWNQPRTDWVIELHAAPNTTFSTFPGHDCTGRSPGAVMVCKPNGPYPPGTTEESFKVRIRWAEGGPGGLGMVWLHRPGISGPNDRYAVVGTGGPAPSASKTPSRRPMVSPVVTVSDVPVDESGSPTNIVEDTESEPPSAQASASKPVGLATGLWIGVGAILVSLGLLAGLLVLRRGNGGGDEASDPLGQ